jgi:hypothetical protein
MVGCFISSSEYESRFANLTLFEASLFSDINEKIKTLNTNKNVTKIGMSSNLPTSECYNLSKRLNAKIKTTANIHALVPPKKSVISNNDIIIKYFLPAPCPLTHL